MFVLKCIDLFINQFQSCAGANPLFPSQLLRKKRIINLICTLNMIDLIYCLKISPLF